MMTPVVEPVTWSHVVARFDAARNAWFGTVDVARIAPSAALLWSSDDYFGTKRRWQAG
jgi:hypothetical protein